AGVGDAVSHRARRAFDRGLQMAPRLGEIAAGGCGQRRIESPELALGPRIVEVGSELRDALERLDDLDPPFDELREAAGAREHALANGFQIEKLRRGGTHPRYRLAPPCF